MIVPALFALALAVQSPAADSLYQLALRLPESRLTVEARARSLAVREAIADAMTRVVREPGQATEALDAARRLAGSYAAAWQDSFLVRQVERFAGMPAPRRAARIRADSLRRAGVAAFSQRGPAAAIALWRRALAGYRSLSDTAGMAAMFDNIGAGLTRLGRLDSAEVYHRRGSTLAAVVGDLRVQANAVGHLGDLAAERGNPARARDQYLRALELRARIGDSRGVAADHNNLGLLARESGDAAEARRQFEAALAINRADARDESVATNLVNLAGLAAIEGDFAQAAAQYRDAIAIWRDREAWADAAVALHGLGQLEIRRGDYPAARAVLTEALAIFQRTGPPSDVVLARGDLSSALAAAGDIQGALEQVDQAEHYADSIAMDGYSRAALVLARADLLVRLNNFADAERRYVEARRLFQAARDPGGEAEALQGLGWLALTRENPARAQVLLGAALRIQTSAGSRREAAHTRVALAWAGFQRGDTASARRQLAQAAVELDRLGDSLASADALGERGALELAAGAGTTAESFYRLALRRMEGRNAPAVSSRLRAGLAAALESRGAWDAASRELRFAADAAEASSRTLRLPERRSAFLADKWDVYARLAMVERRRGLTAAAFDASERLRARETLELLMLGRVGSTGDDAGDLVEREQDLRRRIGELTGMVESSLSAGERLRGPDLSQASVPAREALLEAQSEYTDLLLRMRERAPRHGAFVAPRLASARDVSQRLAPDQALITYLIGDSASVAFVVTRDSVATVDLGATRRELARQVEFVRGALDGRRSDTLWRGPMRRLYGHLIAPIEDAGLLAGTSRLVIVPHAELHYLPFAALQMPDSRRFLGERYVITLTPSASVWRALGDRNGPRGSGVLAFAPRPEALPASRREVAAIERLMGNADVRIGPGATEDVLRREASTRSILHLATYGVLNKQNPLFSFVEMAPGEKQDGRLEVHEVFGLRLRADLVVLSACQTGLGSGALADVPAGDDWVGLTGAFLHAGAGSVIASLWPVDDWATAALMEQLYEELGRGASPAQALTRAQRALQAGATTAHPFYWAGFVLVGGAERATQGGMRP